MWRKSSHSANGTCVELRRHNGDVQIRDSKDFRLDAPTLNLSIEAFAGLLEVVRGAYTV